jgi:Fe-S cluster assembly iron-binding protein IscA
MVELTEAATRHLARLRERRGYTGSGGARFVEGGIAVGLTFTDGPRPGDQVLSVDSLPVYLAPGIAERLDDHIIDIGRRNGQPTLYLRLPDSDESPADG